MDRTKSKEKVKTLMLEFGKSKDVSNLKNLKAQIYIEILKPLQGIEIEFARKSIEVFNENIDKYISAIELGKLSNKIKNGLNNSFYSLEALLEVNL